MTLRSLPVVARIYFDRINLISIVMGSRIGMLNFWTPFRYSRIDT